MQIQDGIWYEVKSTAVSKSSQAAMDRAAQEAIRKALPTVWSHPAYRRVDIREAAYSISCTVAAHDAALSTGAAAQLPHTSAGAGSNAQMAASCPGAAARAPVGAAASSDADAAVGFEIPVGLRVKTTRQPERAGSCHKSLLADLLGGPAGSGTPSRNKPGQGRSGFGTAMSPTAFSRDSPVTGLSPSRNKYIGGRTDFAPSASPTAQTNPWTAADRASASPRYHLAGMMVDELQLDWGKMQLRGEPWQIADRPLLAAFGRSDGSLCLSLDKLRLLSVDAVRAVLEPHLPSGTTFDSWQEGSKTGVRIRVPGAADLVLLGEVGTWLCVTSSTDQVGWCDAYEFETGGPVTRAILRLVAPQGVCCSESAEPYTRASWWSLRSVTPVGCFAV